MNSIKLLLSLACIFLLVNASAQEKFRLEYKYEKGKTYRYQEETKFESVQEVSGQEMKASGTTASKMKMAVEDISPEGNIKFVSSYDDLRVSTKMAMMDTTMVMTEFLDKKTQTILSRSGKVIDQRPIDSIDIAKNMLSGRSSLSDLSKEFVILPENEVKQGDSWNDDRTDTVEGTQMVTRTVRRFTLTGTEEKNGHSCFKISFTGDLEIGGKMSQMGMEFFMEGMGETSGILWIEKESCIIIAKESTTDQDITMAMTGQMQMTIPITTTTVSTFLLIE